ncbi:unnamed protein product [Parascedosporium putredinis]|uniref:Uncharacterized protein n=1 Tax=Parascedosporium putredinis TaxID=1442378 RepID=A0A9P1H319_9PEZI|nr:unnamed protein product [Parascedosporium putredinis]CAI7994132.1 unnamed protein product [Parascedosporium putredinis]
MSSTSGEVCELWNGQEVVRCMGSAPVVEFICVLPEDDGSDQDGHRNFKITVRSLKDKGEEECLDEIDLNIKDDLQRWRSSLRAERDPEQRSLGSSPKITILRNAKLSAPNIS